MSADTKTIKASGHINKSGVIEELEQAYRDWFDVKQVGGIALSSGRGEGTAELAGVQADDVMEIVLDEDIHLFVRRDDFEREFPSQTSRAGADGDLVVQSLQFGPPSRGVKDWVIKFLDVFHVDIAEKSGLAVCKKFEKKCVQKPALYKVEQADSLQLKPTRFAADRDSAEPMLVFIHGTASSTAGSFGGLWEDGSAQLREELFQRYEDRICALEHWTLSQSPIRNAIDLVKALPDQVTLHLVSHSRGGIVGELVCRSMVNDEGDPFLPVELKCYRDRAAAIVKELDDAGDATSDAYAEQVRQLEELNGLLVKKQIKVERFVRVACPARGTTLASGRLDRWLSVFFNVVGLIPAVRATAYYPLLKNFIRALVKTRTKPQLLPGLEAQMPTSPMIALLNGGDRKLAGDLTVIAGDIERDSLLGRIALLLPDQFYDTEHDLVVNTPSMYGGSERETGERYFFDQGAGVTHFNYFRNDQTASRVLKGLTLSGDELADYFIERLPESEGPIPSRSYRARKGPQPVVFLLPGIMGSELDAGKTTIWASKFRLSLGGMARLKITRNDISSSGLIRDSYWNLIEYLSQKTEVIPFDYDWRALVDADREVDEAQRLADAIEEKVDQALQQDQPVSILAHSMGGLLARLMMVRHRHVWQSMLKHPDSRLVMLGTPNGGSFSIPRMLFGHDKVVKGLALIDIRHEQRHLLDIIRSYPGVLFMLPFGDDQFDFFAEKTWDQLGKLDSKEFGAPVKAQLAEARKLRAQINTHPLGLEDAGRVLYVAGRADETPVALAIEDNKPVFKGTSRGDGRVPWATGIPTGVQAWYMDARHGDMANHRPGFEAISDLLATGRTDRLPDHEPASARGIPVQFDMRPDEVDIYPGEKEIHAWALDARTVRPLRKTRTGMIKLRITHGNLAFSRNPVMVGHYSGDGIFSAEKYLDKCLDGHLSRCHALDLYPGPIGSAELILNKKHVKPAGALIVGLGDVGKLTVPILSETVSKALHRYAFDMQKHAIDNGTAPTMRPSLAISSLLVGASAGGMPLLDALMAIMQGVKKANDTLMAGNAGSSLSIDELQLIELWEDKAILATRATEYLFRVNSELRDAFIYDSTLEQVQGGQSRAFHEEEAGWWNRLQIEGLDDGSLSFHSITDKARTEKRLVATDREKVDQFLQQATASTWTNRALPKTLFEMLVPNELKDASQELGDTILVVNQQAARYPWELLEDRLSHSGKPLAVQNRFIRQLESETFRSEPKMSPGDRALVIGEPHTRNEKLWPRLKGAVEEGQLVAGVLASEGGLNVTKLINPDANGVLKAILSDSYRVMHLAGHGVHEFNMKKALMRLGMTDEAAKAGDNVSGMVIGDGVFLNAGDINQMRHVPELVFINCCHLARSDQIEQRTNFPGLAANLATQFIRMGVRAVVAAGWEVDDAAAMTFARVFYRSMIQGRDFGEAVFQARKEVFGQHGEVNTWGAYQCYGDPQYTLNKRRPSWSRPYERPQTPNDLITRLCNLASLAATETDAGRRGRFEQIEQYLDKKNNPQLNEWEKRGDVCAAIGQTLGEFDHFEDAVSWYEKAAACEDATASVKAFEQHANLLARHVASVAAARATKAGYRSAERAIDRAIDILNQIDAVSSKIHVSRDVRTIERECLRGSAYKRLAFIRAHGGAGRSEIQDALRLMYKHYRMADELHLEGKGEHYYYPYTNSLFASTILGLLSGRFQELQPKEKVILLRLQKDSANKDRVEPDFWNMASSVDCELLLRINDGTLPRHVDLIAEGYLNARKRAATPREFRSVKETVDFLIGLVDPKIGTAMSKAIRLKMNKALLDIRQKLD